MSYFEKNKDFKSWKGPYSGLTRRICVLFGFLGLALELSSWHLVGDPIISEFAFARILISLIALLIGIFSGALFSSRHCAWFCSVLLLLMPLTVGIERGGVDANTMAFSATLPVFYTLLLGSRYTILGAVSGLFLILFLAFAPLESFHAMFSSAPFQVQDNVLNRELALGGVLPLLLSAAATYTLARQNQQMQDKLNHDAAFDNLTGIPNRRAFDRQVVDEIERAQRVKTPLSMMVFDIDNFKMYNDLYGHQAGDQALQTVARAIDGVCVRSTDFVARYGGEEFVALLPATTDDRAELLAAKIRANLRRINSGPVADHKITLSAGIAVLNGEARINAEELFRRADEALYESKRSGKDCVTVYSNSEEKATSLRSIK